MESVIETKASTIVQFIDGLRGDLRVTFEEGTWAACLWIQRYVHGLHPSRNALGWWPEHFLLIPTWHLSGLTGRRPQVFEQERQTQSHAQ